MGERAHLPGLLSAPDFLQVTRRPPRDPKAPATAPAGILRGTAVGDRFLEVDLPVQ
jgi:hypothetical protein